MINNLSCQRRRRLAFKISSRTRLGRVAASLTAESRLVHGSFGKAAIIPGHQALHLAVEDQGTSVTNPSLSHGNYLVMSFSLSHLDREPQPISFCFGIHPMYTVQYHTHRKTVHFEAVPHFSFSSLSLSLVVIMLLSLKV